MNAVFKCLFVLATLIGHSLCQSTTEGPGLNLDDDKTFKGIARTLYDLMPKEIKSKLVGCAKGNNFEESQVKFKTEGNNKDDFEEVPNGLACLVRCYERKLIGFEDSESKTQKTEKYDAFIDKLYNLTGVEISRNSKEIQALQDLREKYKAAFKKCLESKNEDIKFAGVKDEKCANDFALSFCVFNNVREKGVTHKMWLKVAVEMKTLLAKS